MGSLYFKRYFASRSVLDYNLTAFGLSAILIGLKVIGRYDRNYRINELAKKGYKIRFGHEIESSEVEKCNKDILAYEFDILKYLKFDLYMRPPLSIVKDIALAHKDIQSRDSKCTHEECSKEPHCKVILRAAEIIDNACYSDVFIMFQVRDIATACYYLAKRAMKIPCTPEEFGGDPTLLKRICVCILKDTSKAVEYIKSISGAAATSTTKT